MENNQLWQEALEKSIPLISYSIICGGTQDSISKAIAEIEAEANNIFPSEDLPEIAPTVL